ncbi:dyslexia-associated protein KIAA0319 homolog precursor [Mus musculus]|uniref:Dyslexia-associated protein KIAA0319 homolog n=1 Tax=Mus musculus TaxID=10090 RepID=K0319_MOUSE|nr:dyslexia-associated protein KIAA0319 homolog precursor [Mus musculus]Q5SZV5.1 RecName: Full=Dyslexia-associated protein KIAA0319 homolog; Flags: Precursor [Mus musculus]AAI15724.1 RIKEN cDNA D130043K22 gene [Mus musculus]AAI15941.1 RIKEN cDNA D130043K22 gene [Mus musculus]CAI26085.1 novel protein (D130043K22Rik) [Mus musculus]|eukprot:NP_001074520.1 dyslexia-associated protein KIAA0319 homolog precursor [Mus musculus]
MVSPPGVLSSLLLLAAMAGGSSQQCSEGRTYSDAIISPNPETIRIMRVSQTFSVGDCTAACCDLLTCDLAWWFEGSCYLVKCMRSENCEPRTTGPIRSYLTFVRRPVQRPGQLLDYGDMMLSRGSPSGAWGDSLEDLRKDLPFLGKDGGPEETTEYSDEYKDLERGLLQPSNQQDPRGSAEYPDWSLLPSNEGGFNATATGDNSAASMEKLQDPTPHPLDQEQLQALNESTWSPTPGHSSISSVWPSSASPLPTEEGLEGEETLQLQEQPSNSSGKEVPMPSHNPSPASLESSPATTEKNSNFTVTPRSRKHSTPTFPTSTVLTGLTPPPWPLSPTASRTVKALAVSAGDNLVLTLPDREAELKASVEPAPPADTTYSYEWSLMSHPVDFQGKIKQENKPTLHLSQLSVGLYAFRVAVSSENAFGEGYVNVTVMPAARVNQPPVAVVSPQTQELSVPLTSALIDGSQSTDDTEIVSYHWEEVDGPFLGEEFPADTPILRLSNLVPGNYTFRLTITDSDGATNSTTASLVIRDAVDYPPVANAGPNQTITLPQNTIILNGNQSSDDHQIVLYEWFAGPGGESKEMVMQGAQTPYLHLSELQEGEYTFQLMVTDSSGQQSTALVAVTVQAENNQAPVAVAGPDKELVFPVQSATLDGSRSSDDHGIVCYHWEHIRGPSAVEMENVDKAIATVTGLQVGIYHFRLTVRDQQGLSSTSTLTVAVKKENNSPPRAQAGGRHVLILPNNSITLDGSRSTDDRGIVSYLWIRDGQSPAAGDVIGGSDHRAALQLTNLVEGVYTFHLLVTDSQGASDSDAATVEVLPDPKKDGLVELILQVGVEQLTEQQKETLVRQLAVLLNVLDSDVKVLKIQAHTDVSTVIVFYVQSGSPFKVLRAAAVARNLHKRLSKEKEAFLLFKVLRVDTAGCLLKCSGHGHCDPITKRCICSQLWMENLIQRYMWDGESNCEWSVFYVAALALTLTLLTGAVSWLCICCCRRRKRTKIRKKTKYTILDSMDEQERMELRPKYGIKHRSTEHNSSLMVSESEFESDQDTLFSRERMERGVLKGSLNGCARNGVSFGYYSKDR